MPMDWIDPALLKRYLAGTLSKDEQKQVEAWFRDIVAAQSEDQIEAAWNDFDYDGDDKPDDQSRRLLIKSLRFILEHDHSLEHKSKDAIRAKLERLLLEREQAEADTMPLSLPDGPEGHTVSMRLRPSLIKWAASVALLVVAFYAVRHFLDRTHEKSKVASTEYRIEATTPGQKLTIYLPDGSKVILNSASELIYPSSFAAGTREIVLKGEGFFEVAKDPTRPFIVTAGNISTMALGTSFNVRAFESEQKVEVALVSGKVSVRHIEKQSGESENDVILLPGDVANFSATTGKLETGKYNAKETLSWKENILYFNHTSLDEAFETLARWYGIEFTIAGQSDDTLYFNGEFHNQSLRAVLEVMSYSNHFTYRIEDDRVAIDFSEKQ